MPAQQLFLRVRGLLCARHKKPVNDGLTTLALMVSGLILGRSVQLWEIAVWIPWDIQLTSGVRRFERWLADPHVKVAELFEPFVVAMSSLPLRLLTDGTPSPSASAARMTSFALAPSWTASAWISPLSPSGTRRRTAGLPPASTLR